MAATAIRQPWREKERPARSAHDANGDARQFEQIFGRNTRTTVLTARRQPSVPCELLKRLLAWGACALLAQTLGAAPKLTLEVINEASVAFIDPETGIEANIRPAMVKMLVTLDEEPRAFQFSKSASNPSPRRNDEVIFTLSGRNFQIAHARGIPVRIDGGMENLIVLRDLIPANTSFARVQGAGNARVLYHRVGTPLHDYATAPLDDPRSIDAIAFGFGDLPAGSDFSAAFAVKVHANASGPIRNVAQLYLDDRVNVPPTILDSQSAVLQVELTPPFIDFYQSDAFGDSAERARLHSPLFIQADAAQCNQDPTVIETNVITIASAKTGDFETFTAVETAPNSGAFRIYKLIPTQDARLVAVVREDGVIETVRGDTLTASIYGCGSVVTETTILIDPAGVVFDSRTDQPLPGFTVTLLNEATSAPATVFKADGVTPAPHTVITDANGRYEFPTVAPGRYRLQVSPPPGYSVPSQVSTPGLPPGRIIDVSGSYLGSFPVTLATGPVQIDVPADRLDLGNAGLFVQKKVSRQTAEIGDLLVYSIKVKNVSGGSATGGRLIDDLPAGFAYQRGSARLDGAARPDPDSLGNGRLDFSLGAIADNTTVTLSYRVRVGPGALEGDGINRAQAVAGALASNVAAEYVRVEAGVFTEKGVVLGKIFIDRNRNRIQDEEELGIPGVRFYLEDGSWVVSDSEGKYSFYGVSPRTHVIKVDPITLPRGAELAPLSTRHAGDPNSRFIELKRGELHKANFAVTGRDAELLSAVLERRAKGEVAVAEIEKSVKERLTPDGTTIRVGDPKSLPASGLVGTGAASVPTQALAASGEGAGLTPQPNFTPVLPANMLNGANSQLPGAPVRFIPEFPLENIATNLVDNALDFIDLKEGDTLPARQTTVRVKGVAGAHFALTVNSDETIPARAGKKVVLAEKQIEAWEFIGVPLRAGTNQIEVKMLDTLGNTRGSKVIQVIAPDKLARIKVTLPPRDQPADGVTPARIIVRLEDEKGVKVTARTPLTLEASLGRWKMDDLDPKEPGHQAFIEGGQAEFELLPPQEPGDARLVISSGALQTETTLPFLPDLRPMLAVGVLEGTVNISRLNRSALVPARSRDGFEEELRGFAASSDDGKTRGAARAAFFLKGKIKGEYLLTAGYDSDKDTKERLFRDIQPDEFYPVYGDSSLRGYDAQSTGRLYVRVDKRKSYLLWGDFNTQTTSEARALGNYNRSLTGIKEHYEKNRLSLNVWASQDSTRQVIEELPANGTSGPYHFRIRDGIVNSEVVEVITRDRHQPSQIIKTEQVSRFVDYEFEPFTGRILFKAPVPSLDSNLNPIFIRVTYEADQGGEKFWVYGADGQVKINSRLEIGGAAVRDENPMGSYGLYSGNATVKITEKTFLVGEVAQSDAELGGVGQAGRVEIRHKGERTDARLYIGKTDPQFTNNASILMPGRVEGGAKVTYKLNEKTAVIGQGLISEDTAADGSRKGVRVDVERSLGHGFKIEAGARHSEETATPASPSTIGITPNEVNSLRGKLTAPVPKLKDASVYGEYENDILETDRRMVALGADYQIANRTKLYARHEFINALGGPFELNSFQQHNTTVVGLETDYMKDGTLFNEYRARSAFNGRESEAATGLRNLWTVSEGVRLNTAVERVTPFNEGGQNEATSVAGGIEYTRNPLSKTTARLELRASEQNDSLLNTLAYARKINKDWTFLSKTILMMVDNKGPNVGDKNQGRVQLGMAYRQTDTDIWNALAKYEFKYEEDGSQPAALLRRQVNILSLDANYQPVADWTFNAHYAGKLANDHIDGENDLYHAHLIGGRVSYEITRRWDIGLNFNTLFNGALDQQQFGIGPEIGFLVKSNLRIAIGYNVLGFRDDDLDTDGYTNPGFFVNLRLKFDETLFGPRKRKEEGRTP